MAKVEKINQTKDNIAITGDSVTFSDLTITNKDLADYLAESDNMLESLESIIEIGVKTMNSLKTPSRETLQNRPSKPLQRR